MNNKFILNTLRFIGLLLLQVLVIDNIRLGHYIHPYIYVLYILLLPFDIPKYQLLLAGFGIGLAVDLFCGTPGLNAAATVFMAFMRPTIIKITTIRKDIDENETPTINTMGISWFFVYSLLLLILHNLILFILESFSFKLLNITLIQIVLSVLSSELLILVIVFLFKKSKKITS